MQMEIGRHRHKPQDVAIRETEEREKGEGTGIHYQGITTVAAW